jgi:hypothetical protein
MQISLTQSILNTVIINGSPEPYNYTWQLIADDNGIETIFYSDDYSDRPELYSTIDIIVSEYEVGLTAGIIDNPVGTYSYFVHQMPDPYDLNLNNSLAIIQSGKLEIKKD